MKKITDLYPQLGIPRKVVITTHQKPDADAMGASLALKHFLTQFGHSVTVISPTNWAGWLNWMPGINEVLNFENEKEKSEQILAQAEWLFCLDFNNFLRTPSLTSVLQKINCTKILIDHHLEPETERFDYGISDITKSSTCEMIFDFIVDSGHTDKINISVSECIYAGVVADTGSFRFATTSAAVHRLAATLKDKGLKHTHIHEYLFENFLENRLRFIGHVLINRMEVLYEYNTVLIAIPKSDLLKFDIRVGDTEGLVNFPQSIKGIKLVALVIDREEERKWSFRSKGDFDCNTFARKYFQGGGHFNAAGGRSSDTLEQTVCNFKKILKENEKLLQ